MFLVSRRYTLLFCYLFFSLILFILSEEASSINNNLSPDIRVLIDNSRSMQESDSQNYRISSLLLLIKLIPSGAKAGVWFFSDKIVPLIPHRVVDDAWRADALRIIDKIEVKNIDQGVNIPHAVDKALYDISDLGTSKYGSGIILLTDGGLKISPSPIVNAAASSEFLRDIADNHSKINVPIHTIALKRGADKRFLSNISYITSGLSYYTEKPEELAEIYVNTLDTIENRSFIPVTKDKFYIDESVREFTLLVFLSNKENSIEIVSPNGKRYSQTRISEESAWFKQNEYMIFTVDNPGIGAWSIHSNHTYKARVTVLSDLTIEALKYPSSIPVGSENEFRAWLNFKGKKITDLAFLSSLKFDLTTTTMLGGETRIINVEELAPLPNGDLRVMVPGFRKIGRYHLSFRLTGREFRRIFPIDIDVFALADSEINTRENLIRATSYMYPSTKIILAVFVFLISLSIFLLVFRRISVQKKEKWLRRLSFTSSLE